MIPGSRRAASAAAASALAALLTLAGCGSTGEEAPRPAPATSSPVDSVRVGLTEWSIEVSDPRVAPGEVTLVVTDAGGTGHDLVVKGRAGEWETPELRPGERTALTVTAKPGERLTLWCDLPGHRAQGMSTELVVADGAG